MRQTNVRGSLSLRGFRKLRTGAIVATGVILLGLGFLAPTVSASEQDGVWVARTVEEVKADFQKEGDLFKYVIKWGDTLSVISEASNIPVDVLQEMNQASGKNLFLPHNELYFTEAETVSDTVTKHKIVIKESGASGEVRTYEVLLKKDQETKAVTFELTDVTEKVEKMTVNYSPVYQPVSAPVVERAEESGEEPASETSAETSPEVKEETAAPVAPKAEDAATTPAPKETAPEVVTPAPKEEKPATSAPKEVGITGTEGTDDTKSNEETVNQPIASNPSSEATTPSAKDSASGDTTAPETSTNTEETVNQSVDSSHSGADSSTSVTEDNNAETNSQNAEASTGDGNSETTTSTSDKAKREEVVNGTEETDGANVESEQKAETPKVEESESEATTSGNQGQPVEESSETKEAESTPVTDNVPSNNSSTDATTDGNSNDSTSNEENSQDDEPAVEHQDSEKSLEEDTKNSNKAAIDDHKKLAEEAISTSDLDDTQKQEARDRLNELTNLYYKKLEEEKDFEKQTQLVDEYETLSQSIQTPGATIEGAADYTKPIESHTGGTTIDENSTVANSALTSSNPSSQPSSSEDSSQTQPVATSDSSATGNSSFRSAVTYQPWVTRRPRSVSEPQNKVSIYYNFDGMKDIPGFFDDLGGKNEVDIPKGVSGEALKSILKARIDKKKAELESKGYKISDEYFVGIDQADATHYDYVVTFTKETTGTTGFRIAPKVQVRAKKVVKRDLSNKTKHINVYYNLISLKDIAGALGELGGENVLTFSGETSKEELKRAVEEKTKAQIEKLKKQGFKVTSTTDLNQIIEGGDSYDYVVEFTKESKMQPVGTTGFRMAPAVQPRASRNRRSLEQPAPQKVKVNVFYNFDQMKDIADFLGDINGTPLEVAAGSTDDEVKAAVKNQVDAKKEELRKRGYTVKEDYLYKNNGKDYNYVVTFSKAAK